MPVSSPLRLSQLTAAIADVLSQAFTDNRFWVVADVTSHTFKPEKNYHTFELVEKDGRSNALLARAQAKAWGKGAMNIHHFQVVTGKRFTNNISVLVHVSIEYHSLYGLQLNVHDIDVHFTLGVLEQERRATLDRLVKENPDFIRRIGDRFITKNKELSLGLVIQRIAVISSRTSAGWQDFHHTLESNPFGYRFQIDDYFTVVQGESNAEQFLDKLVDVFTSHKPYDAVVIIRGGGAQMDFLLFDNYRIGMAVAKFPIPVITGIGHQKNETITDLMAHTQTKTPTQAAEFIIDHNRGFEDSVNRMQQTIVIRSQQQCSLRQQHLYQLQRVIADNSRQVLSEKSRRLYAIAAQLSSRPRMLILSRQNDVRRAASDIGQFSNFYLRNQKASLEHFISMVRLVSPENMIRRGFAVIKYNNRITADADLLEVGKDLDILLSDKVITTTIKSKQDYHGSEFNV